ncbi:hypothetical protein M378DRAFT_182546 [Amanita muscaria Koide BX008]|uniref:Uncharacterized protein n=1 Tax=Amanita muscaria (strain Koide BX008) TaxID=946122 RepID=A0A0C2WCW9_AMAMK|nr:hypothetical protein M378DRAFT_182546 [Amanita muscaria Koide BX008]
MPPANLTMYAQFEQENPSKLPILTEGKIMPLELFRFEMGCQTYFDVKDVTKDVDQVRRTMAGIRDLAIRSWLHSNHARLLTLSFAEFMKDLRKRALDTDWEFDVRRDMMMSKYTLDLDFQNWADNIVGLNCILTGTDQHYDDKGLLELLRANLENDLNSEVRSPKSQVRMDSIKNWVEDVRRLADTERRHLKRARANWDDWQQRSVKRPAMVSALSDRPRPFSNNTNSVSSTNSFSSANSSMTALRVPTLTGVEKDLLDKHQGCRRCRKFYTGHRASDMKCDFPDAKTYKPLTEAMALATKRQQEARPRNPGSGSSAARVTAVVSCPSSPDRAQSPVAAILSDDECIDFGEESEDVDENIRVSDYKLKHLRFDCVVHGANHETKNLNVFLDCGAPYVLIHTSLVQSLGLKQRRLPKTENFEVATRNPIPNSVTHYVWLRISVPVSGWIAKKVMALVSPSLSMPLLLGLPWLSKNRLVTDYELRSCVCKDDNIDILRPSLVRSKRPAPGSRQRREEIAKDRAACMEELQRVCDYRRQLNAGRFECTLPSPPLLPLLASIISKLESSEEMREADKVLREEFQAIFEPIPHVDLLPDEVQARIILKDASKSIVTRSYACPRKYRDAWRLLIQKHLDTGRIRPSSSPFASPAFVIPKTDPSVLPRW